MTHNRDDERTQRATTAAVAGATRPGPGDERGSISVWVSMALVAFMVCLGIGVDFAGHAAADQHARAVAAEAARAGGQFLETQPGSRPRPDVYAATQAATAYITASGFAGFATVEDGVIHTTVTGTVQTNFLGIVGISTLPLSAEGAAEVIPVIHGQES
ncbi:hypothetical protein GCM10028820_31530 [Tessaracoccus terricola]